MSLRWIRGQLTESTLHLPTSSGFPLPGQGNFCWAQLIDSPRNGLSIHVFPLLQYGNGHPNTALLPVRNRKGPTSHSRTSPPKSYFIMKTYFDLPPVTKTLIFVIGTVYLLGLFSAPLHDWMFANLCRDFLLRFLFSSAAVLVFHEKVVPLC